MSLYRVEKLTATRKKYFFTFVAFSRRDCFRVLLFENRTLQVVFIWAETFPMHAVPARVLNFRALALQDLIHTSHHYTVQWVVCTGYQVKSYLTSSIHSTTVLYCAVSGMYMLSGQVLPDLIHTFHHCVVLYTVSGMYRLSGEVLPDLIHTFQQYNMYWGIPLSRLLSFPPYS